MKRREARMKAVQVLFQMTVGQTGLNEAFENVMEGQPVDSFLRGLVQGTFEHRDAIDQLIKGALVHWQFDRLGNIDKTILRLAVYELNYIEDIPTNVTINEAIELAKIYGDDESRKFINGILSKIVQQLS